jgi:hypothetical protein
MTGISSSRPGGATKIASTDDRDGTWNRSFHARHKVAKSESLEYINGMGDRRGDRNGSGSEGDGRSAHGKEIPLEIWQDVEVSIQSYEGGANGKDGERMGRKEVYDGDSDSGLKTKTVVTATATAL